VSRSHWIILGSEGMVADRGKSLMIQSGGKSLMIQSGVDREVCYREGDSIIGTRGRLKLFGFPKEYSLTKWGAL
jgi:hypothetical protein